MAATPQAAFAGRVDDAWAGECIAALAYAIDLT
jgi:hypothetical protein